MHIPQVLNRINSESLGRNKADSFRLYFELQIPSLPSLSPSVGRFPFICKRQMLITTWECCGLNVSPKVHLLETWTPVQQQRRLGHLKKWLCPHEWINVTMAGVYLLIKGWTHAPHPPLTPAPGPFAFHHGIMHQEGPHQIPKPQLWISQPPEL